MTTFKEYLLHICKENNKLDEIAEINDYYDVPVSSIPEEYIYTDQTSFTFSEDYVKLTFLDTSLLAEEGISYEEHSLFPLSLLNSTKEQKEAWMKEQQESKQYQKLFELESTIEGMKYYKKQLKRIFIRNATL